MDYSAANRTEGIQEPRTGQTANSGISNQAEPPFRVDANQPGPSGVASTSGSTGGLRDETPGRALGSHSSTEGTRTISGTSGLRQILDFFSLGASNMPIHQPSALGSQPNRNRISENAVALPTLTISSSPGRIVNSPARLNSSINEFRSPKRRRIESPGKQANLSTEIDEEAEVSKITKCIFIDVRCKK